MFQVDARGEQCPIPVIKTKKALETVKGETSFEVLVDNEIAVENVTKFAQSQGGMATSEKIGEKEFRIVLEMAGRGKTAEVSQSPVISSQEVSLRNQVVVVSSATMGNGKEELGKILMKGFLFAVSQMDSLPKTILFYNSGATLTCEGSDSIEDLKQLKAQGVEIFTCGTCLDYYGLREKLLVGEITNMYTIVEKLAKADSILKP